MSKKETKSKTLRYIRLYNRNKYDGGSEFLMAGMLSKKACCAEKIRSRRSCDRQGRPCIDIYDAYSGELLDRQYPCVWCEDGWFYRIVKETEKCTK